MATSVNNWSAAPASLTRTDRQTLYAKFAWGVLVYNIAVILWGVLVRATSSGAGCGDHWPLCNGQILPQLAQGKTVIEFTHRMMSGVSLIAAVVLYFAARRWFAKGHPVRRGALLTLALVLVEAALGAGIVLLRLVAGDSSPLRAAYLSVHLVNTLLLTAAMALTAWWASGFPDFRLKDQGPWTLLVALGAAGALLLGVSGAITALGDTLFPVSTFKEGLQQDFSSTAHLFIRLRIFHPGMAIAVGGYLAALGLLGPKKHRDGPYVPISGATIIGLVLLQLICGGLDALLAAPVWLQIVHLFIADMVWVAFVFFSAGMLSASLPIDRRA